MSSNSTFVHGLEVASGRKPAVPKLVCFPGMRFSVGLQNDEHVFEIQYKQTNQQLKSNDESVEAAVGFTNEFDHSHHASSRQRGVRKREHRDLELKREAAAIKLQSIVQGREDRQKVSKRHKAATKLQARQRGRMGRQRAQHALHQYNKKHGPSLFQLTFGVCCKAAVAPHVAPLDASRTGNARISTFRNLVDDDIESIVSSRFVDFNFCLQIKWRSCPVSQNTTVPAKKVERMYPAMVAEYKQKVILLSHNCSHIIFSSHMTPISYDSSSQILLQRKYSEDRIQRWFDSGDSRMIKAIVNQPSSNPDPKFIDISHNRRRSLIEDMIEAIVAHGYKEGKLQLRVKWFGATANELAEWFSAAAINLEHPEQVEEYLKDHSYLVMSQLEATKGPTIQRRRSLVDHDIEAVVGQRTSFGKEELQIKWKNTDVATKDDGGEWFPAEIVVAEYPALVEQFKADQSRVEQILKKHEEAAAI